MSQYGWAGRAVVAGAVLRRGLTPLAVALMLVCLIICTLPAPSSAQNTAEAKPAPQRDKSEKAKAAKKTKKAVDEKTRTESEAGADEETNTAEKAASATDEVVEDAASELEGALDETAVADEESVGEALVNTAEGGVLKVVPVTPGSDTAGNTAESRPAAGTAENLAEGDGLPIPGLKEPLDLMRRGPVGSGLRNGDGKDGAAEPPLPEMILPLPETVAGAVEGYTPPEINLVVPSLQPIPEPPLDNDYTQPDRVYLPDRPLPALDETETDQERIARSIEESLGLLTLTGENRPPDGVEIPLPSGVVTFKASDAFQFDRRNRILTFTGNAEIIIGDIAIWADLIEVNDSAATTYAKGYVALQRQDDILYCDEAYMNYDTGTLELFYIEGNTSGPKVQGNVYFTADRAYGSFDRLTMEHVEVTTCDPFCGGPKEAHVGAHKAVFKRNTSIVLHDVWIYARESKIGYVPVLAFPLRRIDDQLDIDEEESNLQQNYGKNRTDGWFAKYAYTYSTRYAENVNGPLLGVAKLDLSQKQGPGIGVRQDFYTPSLGVTTMRAYYQRQWEWLRQEKDGVVAKPTENFDFELNQELNLSKELTGSLTIDRSNQATSSRPGVTTRNNDWRNNFRLNYAKEDTRIGITADQTITKRGGTTGNGGTQSLQSENSSLSAAFTLEQDLNDELKLRYRTDYTAVKGNTSQAGIPADQEGNVSAELNFIGKQDTPRAGYQALLRYSKQGIDYDREKNNTSQDARRTIRREIPSLQVTLPRDLIQDGAYFQNFQINLDNLVSGTRRRQTNAFRAKVAIGGRDDIQFSRASRLDTSVDFSQYWYDDGNAQYVLAPRLNYKYDDGRWFNFGVNYQLNFRQGVRNPPVDGDRTFYDNRLSWNLNMTNHRSWRWDIRGGYDFEHLNSNGRKRSWPLPTTTSSSFYWDPNDTFTLQHTVSYDSASRSWRPSNISARWHSSYTRPDGYYNWYLATRLEADTDYWQLHSLRNIDTTWYKNWGSGWSTELTTSWKQSGSDGGIPSDVGDFLDDYVKRIIVRKVNCCTTIEGGWRTGINEVYVNLYLNALPQYPGTLDTRRLFDDDMTSEFLFPTEGLINDIQTDVFGTNIPLGALGF